MDAHPWVREPLVDWMAQRWSGTRRYDYRVEGTKLDELRITRCEPGEEGQRVISRGLKRQAPQTAVACVIMLCTGRQGVNAHAAL